MALCTVSGYTAQAARIATAPGAWAGEIRVAERVLVPFAGEGSGRGGLSWGQQAIWRDFEVVGTPIWLTGLQAVPDGWTVDDAADQLAYIMGRHQSMRTTLLVDGDRPVQQVVHDSGQIYLQVIDADGGEGPLAIAKALEEKWKEHDLVYDYANDWPVRMALIRHQGKAAYYVRAVSHVVTDGFGALAMYKDIIARDPVTGRPGGPITAMEPLEQAQWQASPAGKRRTQAAEQHWERLLRAIPARRFGEPANPAQAARYGRLTFDSRAAYLASQAIAARTEVANSPVLLAAFAVGLARATGINPVVLRLYVSNRFRPRLAATVSPIAQTCPCVIDVAGITFDEAVKRTYYASLGAYKHAYFEPVRIRELVVAVGEQRGAEIDLSCLYNDIRLTSPRDASGPLPGPRDIRAALARTALRWQDRQNPEGQFNIMIEDSPDTISVLMVLDTHYLGLAQAEATLRGMEDMVVAAACDPDAPTGV